MDTEATRLRLLRGAKTLFSAHGYRNVTVRALAHEAGVNLSLVSYHFGGKEGLYRACLESFALERVRSITRFLGEVDTPETFRLRLQLFIAELFEIFVAEPEISMIIIQEDESDGPLGKELFDTTFLPLMQELEIFFRYAIDRGFLSSRGDPAMVTVLLFSMTCKLFSNIGQGRGRYTLQELRDDNQRKKMVEHILSMVIGGFEVSQ